MQTNIYPQQWLSLPKEVRLHLVFVFKLERTGVTEVRDQTVVSDGYTVEDLQKITLEKMCEYIGSQETFMRAWELTLAKVHAELNPPVGVIGAPTEVEPVIDNSGAVVPEEILDKKLLDFVPEKKFCDTCDSKGVRHKKDCSKFVTPKSHENI